MANAKRRSRKRRSVPTFAVPAQDMLRRDVFHAQKEADEARRTRLVAASVQRRQARQAALQRLNLELQPDLPITEHGEEIKRLLESHQVVVVAGETGSGKTTQLPKICMQLGLGAGGMIGHTQPRRLAARTVARRIAEESGVALGEEVGYAVRFADQVGEGTLLKVMTDGLLLTEIRSDRFLDGYDAIIIDEAHERSLNIDFLLGYLKRLLLRRTDLKVIVTSATIDVTRFASFFNNAPVVSVSGRTYPVEVRYQDVPEEEETLTGVINALHEIDAQPLRGARDVLVFFSGEREIFEAAKVLRREFGERFEVLPLYARLSFAEQKKIFSASSARRRVVLATNVAETSLTVPNIGYVIDPGFARINRYSYRSKLQRLPIEPISQASADQRKGRCGRIAPGTCYRLYTEQDLAGRPEFTDAEIHRVNLASVVLQMQAFRLGDIRSFDFIDPPDPRAIKDAVRLLEELTALKQGRLTDTGRAMARLPIDPRLARMLLEGHHQGALSELLVVVSALSVQDPRERPLQKTQAADESHAGFAHERSDFLSLLNLWNYLEQQRQELTRARFERVLKKRFISRQRWREWREVHRQLLLVCRDLGYRLNTEPAGYRAVHESVLSGSLSLVALHDERGHYQGARNLKLRIFPGSVLAGRTPKWIVAGEITETSRVYARHVAAVEAAWIERQGQHLVKNQFSEPFWSAKRGEVLAYKNVSLYGLRLAERRQVSYADIDPVVCRDLFIRDGLVAGQMADPPDFLSHNLREVARIEDLEAKGRRRDLLVNDDEIYAFYANAIPAHIVRTADLRKWLRGSHADRVQSLYLDEAFLLRTAEGRVGEADFPAEMMLGTVSLALKYKFAPGEPDDGVTLRVPVGVLAGVGAESLEWLVPGLLPALVEQWLRTLPKHKRRLLVPLPDKVEEFSRELLKTDRYRQGRLLAALATLIADRYKVSVSETDWDRSRIDPHLLMRIEVIDEQGRLLAADRDIRVLKQRLAQQGEDAPGQDAARDFAQQALTEFPSVSLHHHELLGPSTAPVIKYPGLVDQRESVDLMLFDAERERDAAHRRGLQRLALLKLGKVGSYFRKELDKHPQLGLHYASLGNAQQLKDELLRNVVWYCFFESHPLPENAAQFADLLEAGRGELAAVFDRTVSLFAQIMALRFECVTALNALTSAAYERSKADINTQLQRLAPADVLDVTPSRFLTLVPRYLSGTLRRIQNLPGHVPKDLKQINEITPLLQRLSKIAEQELAEPARCDELRFYLEELRLTLFAEALARQKVAQHPLDDAYFGANWKASLKRAGAVLLAEEQRVGLA